MKGDVENDERVIVVNGAGGADKGQTRWTCENPGVLPNSPSPFTFSPPTAPLARVMAQTPPQAPNPGIEPPSSLAPSLPSSESTGHAIRINFPEIAMLVRHKRFHEVVKACESMEISVSYLPPFLFGRQTECTVQVPDNGDPSRLLLTTPLVLACLILDDMWVLKGFVVP